MTYSPIKDAERLGYRQFSYPGKRAFPRLTMSYICSSFRQPTYDDSMARLRMHVLLYWVRGMYKSASISTFIRRCMSSTNITSQKQYSNKELSHLDCLKFTRARLQGSVSDNGAFVFPLIQRPHIIFIDEYVNLLGSGDSLQDMLGFLNSVLESGESTVSNVRMILKELPPELLAKLEARGISFNAEEGLMSYQVNGTLWAACHDLDYKFAEMLERSGNFDRLNVVRWKPTEEEFDEAWMHEPPILSQNEFDPLKKWNQALWDAEWKTVNSPPEKMILDCKRVLAAEYNRLEKQLGLSKAGGLRSARDSTNLRQIMTAFATVDTVQNDGKGPYDSIRYDLNCLEDTLNFLPEYVISRCGAPGALVKKSAASTDSTVPKFEHPMQVRKQVTLT